MGLETGRRSIFKRHRVIRWAIQLLFLTLFALFFLQNTYSSPIKSPQYFFRFDPLILVITGIALRALIAAALLSLVVIAGTLVFGRFYCGFICPLGTVIDVADLLTGYRSKGKRPAPAARYLPMIKYAILALLVVSAALGSSFLHFFDPLAITERTMTLILHPVVTYVASAVSSTRPAVFTETLLALSGVIMVLGAGFFLKRAWCRIACPLGAMLGLASRISLLKFSLNEKCNTCGVCESECPVGAIDLKIRTLDPGECTACLRCVNECGQGGAGYGIGLRPGRFSMTRRQVLAAGAAALALAPLSRTMLHGRLEGRLIRPPGALPENDFLNACVHCGACMKACPTNGLQPCLFEAGVNGIWTPRLAARIGGCEKNCNRCGQVCPTAAIRELSLEEKSFAKIGTAAIDRSRCIAWEQDKVCLICDEACQYNAIASRETPGSAFRIVRPFVDEKICMGCGVCESRCPLEGRSAIEVYSLGEERKRSGSFLTPEKRRLRDSTFIKDDIPAGFILE